MKHLSIYFYNIFVISMLSFITPHNGFAQINLSQKKNFANDVCIIGNISGGEALNYLSALGSKYYAPEPEHKIYARIFNESLTIGIMVITANRFDDAMEIALGTNIQTTLDSITDIIEWYGSANVGNSITFTDIEGREVMLSKTKNNIEIKILKNINKSVVTGNAVLKMKNLEKAYTMVEYVAPEKIYEFMLKAGMDSHEYVINYEKGLRAKEEHMAELKTILDNLKPQMDAIKDSIKVARKLNDPQKVKVLIDSLNTMKSNYDTIYQLLYPTTKSLYEPNLD